MSQRYTSPVARERMAHGLCPECGAPAATHLADARFWVPRLCDLTHQGVVDRIRQHTWDQS